MTMQIEINRAGNAPAQPCGGRRAGRRRMSRALGLLGMACWATVASASFQTPENITQGEGSGAHTQLSRNPQGSLLALGSQRLALAYFQGNDSMTPGSPSRIYLREWTAAGGWGARQRVDHSLTDGNQEVGGRHPAMVRRADGAVALAWHDGRNCTAAHNWIDNLELYGNTWTSGTVQTTDTRLTLSAAAGVGDNGYNPRLARLNGGRLAMIWYDFTWNASQSEIALRLSGPEGEWSDAPAMDDTRLTTAGTRVSGDSAASFTQPALAVAANGLLHVCWVTGTSAAGARLYRGVVDPATGKLTSWAEAATGVSGFFDPPRLIASPTTDTVYLLYHDAGNGPARLITLSQGGAAASAPLQLTPDGVSAGYCDAALDATGKLHLVYVNTGAQTVELRVYDPATGSVGSASTLSGAQTADWLRPCIAIGPDGTTYVAWEEQDDSDANAGAIWFTTDYAPPPSAARDWGLYE